MAEYAAPDGSRSKILYAPANDAALATLTDDATAGIREAHRGSRQIAVDPKHVERGLAKLVLGVVEILRKLLERQAMRRVEGGTLRDDEIERLGITFMRLEQRMQELKDTFGLEAADLDFLLDQLGSLVDEDAECSSPRSQR